MAVLSLKASQRRKMDFEETKELEGDCRREARKKGLMLRKVRRQGYPVSYRLVDRETKKSVTGRSVFFNIEDVEDWLEDRTN